MRPDNFEKLKDLRGGDEHNVAKSRFDAMKLHLLSNEALMDLIIGFNLRGAAQPAYVQGFCEAWKEYTRTGAYKKTNDESKKNEECHVRRAKKIWKLEQEMNRAECIACWINESWANWYH